MSSSNGFTDHVDADVPWQRAREADDLLTSVKDSIVNFIDLADQDAIIKSNGHGIQIPGSGPRTTIVEHHPPRKLESLLDFVLPENGLGREGLLSTVQKVLQYSVNTWDQGFLDKLYASITPVGLAADLLLSALNTNVHVYQVSPALTVIEKTTARALANHFGYQAAHAGGISQPGGSAANQSSMVIARNHFFPETKEHGYGDRKFVLFTSAHGHYSIEKAAQILGFGSHAVHAVSVDSHGCMRPDALEDAIVEAKSRGLTPFYVNATAGTTVLGSFDPLHAIADICTKHNLWLHVDGSWGGPVIFSPSQRHKLQGIERADSIALCPHKMLNIPLTCTFLLGRDMRIFHKGMTLPAGYLFHTGDDDGENDDGSTNSVNPAKDPSAADSSSSTSASHVQQDTTTQKPSSVDAPHPPPTQDFWDLADLTPQCGRRGDSLKLALTWIYVGTSGLAAYIDHGYRAAAHLAELVEKSPVLDLVSENPPPCLQVCFYYSTSASLSSASVVDGDRDEGRDSERSTTERNGKVTVEIARKLMGRGFMVDFAPGEKGKFLRVVVNGQTRLGTVEGLIKAVEEVGSTVVT